MASIRHSLYTLSTKLEKLNRRIAQVAACTVLIMALVICVLVIARNALGWGSVAAQESILYLHSALFLLCLAHTAAADEHVRVDIFYRVKSKIEQSWVDLVGNILFLLPFAMFLLFLSWPYFLQSWAIKEGSASSNGLDLVFILKSLMPLSAILLITHVVSDTLQKSILIISGTRVENKRQEP